MKSNPGMRIVGTVDEGGIIELYDADTTGIMLSGDNGGSQFGLGVASTGDNLVLATLDPNDHITFQTNSAQRMVITDPSGHVGIGTGTPAADPPTNRLNVQDTQDPLRLEGLVEDNTLDSIMVVDGQGVVHWAHIDSLLTASTGFWGYNRW